MLKSTDGVAVSENTFEITGSFTSTTMSIAGNKLEDKGSIKREKSAIETKKCLLAAELFTKNRTHKQLISKTNARVFTSNN